jgi:hypothetical protein
MSRTAKHSALFRDSLGGITIRHFPSAEDAQKHNADRDLAEPAPVPSWPPMPAQQQVDTVIGQKRNTTIKAPAFAAALGVHTRTVRRAFLKGSLPGAVEHGERILVIPSHLLRLAQAYGLRGLERLAKAGRI